MLVQISGDCDFPMKIEFKFKFIDQATSGIVSIAKVVSWSKVASLSQLRIMLAPSL